MAALDQAEANRLLNAMFKATAYTLPTTPLKLKLMTSATTPTATVTGTEPTNSGGSAYAPQDLSAGLASATVSAGSLSNSAAVTFTNMPNATIAHIEVWDNAGSPRRICYAPLAASKTTSTGDSLTFATGALTFAMT